MPSLVGLRGVDGGFCIYIFGFGRMIVFDGVQGELISSTHVCGNIINENGYYYYVYNIL
ncbi:MAG: hypothetical protein ABF289_09760 [Clostridiales bacterium]